MKTSLLQCDAGRIASGAHPGLHSKPMDATIKLVLALDCRGGCDG